MRELTASIFENCSWKHPAFSMAASLISWRVRISLSMSASFSFLFWYARDLTVEFLRQLLDVLYVGKKLIQMLRFLLESRSIWFRRSIDWFTSRMSVSVLEKILLSSS